MSRSSLAYIRRSVSRKGDEGDVSRDFQTDHVKTMAGDPNLEVIDADWGISAAHDHLEKRVGFLTMIDRIEAGGVATVYAYSLDRLSRDVEAGARLLNACERGDTTIVTQEGTFLPGDDAARLLFHVIGATNENAVRQMGKKAKAAAENLRGKRDRGEVNPKTGKVYEVAGRKAYGFDPARPEEDLAAVLAAYDHSRSFLGAARLLNERGSPPTRLGGPWDGATVARIVRRARPALPVAPRKGAAAKAPRLYSGLLRCACGSILTSMPRGGNRQIGWYCREAHRDKRHSRPYVVSEAYVTEWVKKQLDGWRRMALIDQLTTDDDEIAAHLYEVEERRLRVIEMYEMGDLSRDEYLRRMAVIKSTVDRVEATQTAKVAQRIVTMPFIDWNADVTTINAALRGLWVYVQMGKDMRPSRAEWHPTEDYGPDGPHVR